VGTAKASAVAADALIIGDADALAKALVSLDSPAGSAVPRDTLAAVWLSAGVTEGMVAGADTAEFRPATTPSCHKPTPPMASNTTPATTKPTRPARFGARVEVADP